MNSEAPSDAYLPIADYALLSDCHSTALVSSEGSIDWACPRRFDAGSVFGRLLDADRGGYFSISPVEPITAKSRRYLPHTMVLETTLTTATGTVRITDGFAMREGGAQKPRGQLLRSVEGVEGEVEVEVVMEPRFDYGSLHPWLQDRDDGRKVIVGGDDALVVHADIDLRIDQDSCCIDGRKLLRKGERMAVTVSSQPAHLIDTRAVDIGDVDLRMDETIEWWEMWSEATKVEGPHADLLERSALVLKALTCAPTGAIVAAPTTSLPEIPGGTANWDYRYCWVHDATLTLDALSIVGHEEVAQGFRDFIMRSSAGHGSELQIMYGPYGERRLPELKLDLEGWRGSSPVRVGNGAADQMQLDVYGYLVDAVHLWHERTGTIDHGEWRFLSSVIDEACNRRNEKDAGIWELRGELQHYVHSKVMVWVALDRGVRLVEESGLDERVCDLERWRTSRDELRSTIESQGVDPERGNFVQHFGSTDVDASLLLLPLAGFVEATDERMVATVDAIQRDLACDPDGFLLRFRRDASVTEGSGGDAAEGVFLLCTFWLVEVLALQGRLKEARELFERVIAVGNDLGLFAEEFDVENRELLGNYPQAFTHLGLISAEKCLRDATRRA